MRPQQFDDLVRAVVENRPASRRHAVAVLVGATVAGLMPRFGASSVAARQDPCGGKCSPCERCAPDGVCISICPADGTSCCGGVCVSTSCAPPLIFDEGTCRC